MLVTTSVGCSSAKVRRTIASDPQMRVLIDPRIDPAQYVQIRAALVQSKKFQIIERREGWDAMIREQDLQHRSQYADRFSDREKFAHIGASFGAGGIVLASAQCHSGKNFWGTFTRTCEQDLTILDGRTGEVIIEVTGESSIPFSAEWVAPSWTDTVTKATDEFPTYFEPKISEPTLENYKEQSEEVSKREKAAAISRPRNSRLSLTNTDFSVMEKMHSTQSEGE